MGGRRMLTAETKRQRQTPESEKGKVIVCLFFNSARSSRAKASFSTFSALRKGTARRVGDTIKDKLKI